MGPYAKLGYRFWLRKILNELELTLKEVEKPKELKGGKNEIITSRCFSTEKGSCVAREK